MSAPLGSLVARCLTKRYGARTAVDGVDLALVSGRVTGLLGPNGAGKSTLLRMLVGLVRPDAGSVRLAGRSPEEPEARRGLGYLPADPAFARHLSGRSALDLLSALHGQGGAVHRDEVARRLCLTPDDLERPVRELSSGTTQKLGIVAALQHAPSVVLLDEPANRLDPLVHREFRALVRDRASAGCAVLLSSHVLSEVQSVCDRAVLLSDGRVLEVLDVDDLRRHGTRDVRLVFRAPPGRTPQLDAVEQHGRTVTGTLPAGRADLVRALLEDPDVEDVEIGAQSLDEVFSQLYEDRAGRRPQTEEPGRAATARR